MQRIFDITISLFGLTLFSIPLLIVMGLLKFKEKHVIFFKQERIGINKKPFEILKFQTLVNEIPTSTGKILRRTGIDEIPQFINVLKGDMSIVGPRALTNYDIERLCWDDEFHSKRWSILPGISGYAQLYGGQHRKTSWFWDMKYLKKNNLFIDFIVITISFSMNLLGKTRVRNMLWTTSKLK